MGTVAENIAEVRRRMAAAAERVGRAPDEITLIAVSKKVDALAAQEALAADTPHLGEARIQEARSKFEAIGSQAIWHMIGPLQTNKAKYCPGIFGLIHSIDRLELMRELDKKGTQAGVVMKGLLQINIAGETQKSGCHPEDALALLKESASLPALNIVGVMTIPPFKADPEESRPIYRALMELRKELRDADIRNVSLGTISAGMSGDYEIAIEEGATLIRVGTAIFGAR